ncbi:MAG: methionine adenosyltransferase [Nitrospirota bacterium]|nr:methionine adenosyltransferase [Nitrospirota bacterium]
MIIIEPYGARPVTDQRVEIVERKGVGHPDTLCDSMMEAVSIALSREYRKTFGTILHHNIDKGLLAAGRVEKRFGGGKVTEPMDLIIGDRATWSAGKKRIDVEKIAVAAAQEWLGRNMRFVDPKKHVRYRVVLRQGSEELTDIFSRKGKVLGANDTSAAVGYYPLSPTEQAVLGLERFLNSADFKKIFPETGEDIKVMGLRTGDDLDITVAMPILCKYVNSEKEYFVRKAIIQRIMEGYLDRFTSFKSAAVNFNTLDVIGRDMNGIYLSLLGTSAEDADSGQVGRGNRVNGLISLNRPMGTEAAAGKNPVSHVGKIYNVLAHRIAQRIYKEVGGLREVQVLLLSRIGAPINEPQTASAQVLPVKGKVTGSIVRKAEKIMQRELNGIAKFCGELSRGDYPVC